MGRDSDKDVESMTDREVDLRDVPPTAVMAHESQGHVGDDNPPSSS